MKSVYFIIHLGKNPPPQNVCRLKSAFFLIGFTSSTFPIQPDFSQNQPAAITLNTGSPRTLEPLFVRMGPPRPARLPFGQKGQVGENKQVERDSDEARLSPEVGLPLVRRAATPAFRLVW